MADRNKKRARKKNKKRGAMGLLVLELVGVAMFAMLLTFAQGQRATAGNASQVSNAGMPTGSCLLYTSPSPRDKRQSRMPSSA